MDRWLEWLLDLENIRLARDAPLLLKWEGRVQAWILFCFGLAAIASVILVYRRERTSTPRRTALAGIRLLLLALMAALLCRPALVLQRNRVEKAHVSVLVDTSLSMATRERYADGALAATVAAGAGLEGSEATLDRFSRLELAKAALLRDEAAPLRRLLEQNAVHLSTFADVAELLGVAPGVDALGELAALLQQTEAVGESTDIAAAITQVIEKSQGRRVAAIVLASDGQATEPTSLKDALDLARGRQIPIFALRVGSPTVPVDLELGQVRAQESVFLHDLLLVDALVSGSGLPRAVPVTVQLIDERSGAVAATEPLVLEPGSAPVGVELRTKPAQAGRMRYRVQIVPPPNEATLDNNTQAIEVNVLEDRLRVLYVEGYPRYEYRYLKNALLRERSVELSVLLLEADEQFVQEGTFPIRRFPESPEELNRFDVVLFGDVDPRGGWLSAAQATMLVDFVNRDGGGFGLICGERAAPYRFLGTPLEKLLPVRIDPQFLGRYEGSLSSGFSVQLTAEGRRSRLFRTVVAAPLAPREGAGGSATAFDALPELYWLARTLGPKPGATILAEHPTARTLAEQPIGSGLMPVVAAGRYGAGKLFFQATDDTWRWRRHSGELLHDAYWVQVVRELMRESRLGKDRRLAIRTDRRIYDYGRPAEIQVEVSDTELLAAVKDAVSVVVAEQPRTGGVPPVGSVPTAGGEPAARGVTPTGGVPVGGSELAAKGEPAARGVPVGGGELGARGEPAAIVARLSAARLGPESRSFETVYVPPRPGRYVARPDAIDLRPGEQLPSVAFRVTRPDRESRTPQADHELLARVAEATGGKVIDLDRVEEELSEIRDRSVQIPDDVTEPLWDSKLALLFFVLTISLEWTLRKAYGLL